MLISAAYAVSGIWPYFSYSNVSVKSNWVHPPGQPPGISFKKLPGRLGFDFWKYKGQDFVENKSET